MSINLETMRFKETESLYFRKGFKFGKTFLSQKKHGCGGAGDVCEVNAAAVEVGDNLYCRIKILANA